jgi:hypothetical protein
MMISNPGLPDMRPVAIRKTLITALLLLVISYPATAESILPSFTAEYRVKIKILSGRLGMSLSQVDEHYIAKSSVAPRGLTRLLVGGHILEEADFTISDGAIKPNHYESVDTLAGNDSAIVMDFDFAASRATGTRNGEPFELPMNEMAFDRQTLQYGLMLALMYGENPDTFLLFDNGKSKQLSITYHGVDTIKVPYGSLAVRKVQHRTLDSDRVTTLWCAESLNFFPVRIEQRRNGKLAMRAELIHYELQ